MIFENTQIFMIEANGGISKKNTLRSFSKTFKKYKIKNITIIKEKKTRENTLNFILKKKNYL